MVDKQYPQLNTANVVGDELRLIQRINAWVQPEEKVWTDSAEDNTCELQLSFHLTPITPKLLQLTGSSYGMCLGARHGGGVTFAEHFWLNKERTLNADDVFRHPNGPANWRRWCRFSSNGRRLLPESADDLIALVNPPNDGESVPKASLSGKPPTSGPMPWVLNRHFCPGAYSNRCSTQDSAGPQ